MADKRQDPYAILLNRKGKKLPKGALGPLNGPLGWLLVLGVLIAGFLPNLKKSTGLSTPRPTPAPPGQPRQLALPGFEPPPPPKRSTGGTCLIVGIVCLALFLLCLMSCIIPMIRIIF